MTMKPQVTYEGKMYLSIPAAAKLIGTTSTKLKKIMVSEGIECRNLKENGPIRVSAEDIDSYLRRKGLRK